MKKCSAKSFFFMFLLYQNKCSISNVFYTYTQFFLHLYTVFSTPIHSFFYTYKLELH
ncbi:hypothetical protein FTN78_p010002 (plasmid) [Lactococcus lactis subsp. lactis bv. diacetylactis]|nr:hypothetical protein FTN78_p010002 [Lactococcus lactis subsp. lactis bv. diacetylactis]